MEDEAPDILRAALIEERQHGAVSPERSGDAFHPPGRVKLELSRVTAPSVSSASPDTQRRLFQDR